MTLEPCPGCGALFSPSDGATHPYIGASAGCWALYAPLTVGEMPDPALIEASRVPPGRDDPAARSAGDASRWNGLLGDAYAVQHHGDDSPPAVQSVAVHLLTLHGVVAAGQPISSTLWLRRRALRRRGVFRKLAPPAPRLTLRHLFPGGGVDHPVSPGEYVRDVYTVWMRAHAEIVSRWYQDYVVAD